MRNWKWVGSFLWLTIHYDHVFELAGEQKTKLIWVVVAKGFGISLLGRIFAATYGRNLDRAIPLLVAELQAAYPRLQRTGFAHQCEPLSSRIRADALSR